MVENLYWFSPKHWNKNCLIKMIDYLIDTENIFATEIMNKDNFL